MFLASALPAGSEEVFLHDWHSGKNIYGAGERASVLEVPRGPDGDRRKESLAKELSGLCGQGIFKGGIPPQGTEPVKTRFASKIGRGADGSVERYRSRLVSRRHVQRSGVCFLKPLRPVVFDDTM